MYNKIMELCNVLKPLTVDELKENGIEAIMIFAVSDDFNGIAFTKGRMSDVLAMIGQAISRTAKASGVPVDVLLADIRENEKFIEALERKEGD